MTLTRKQRDILEFLAGYIEDEHIAPTLAEIALHFGITKETTHAHLVKLERKGYIARARHEARSIRLLRPPGASGLPAPMEVLGYVSAGRPLEATIDREAFDLDHWLSGDRELFVLRARGDSMIEAGILDGDYVLFERRATAQNGQLVVALVDGDETTLKRYFQERGRVRLQPANREMAAIFPERCEIQGVAIGVVRKFA